MFFLQIFSQTQMGLSTQKGHVSWLIMISAYANNEPFTKRLEFILHHPSWNWVYPISSTSIESIGDGLLLYSYPMWSHNPLLSHDYPL